MIDGQFTIGPLRRDPDFELAFRLREPIPATPEGCVLLLHGVGGSELDLAELATAIGPEVLVVLPRAPLEPAPGQFAWFRVAFTSTGPSIAADEAEESRSRLLRFVGQLQAAHGIRPDKTVVAGFSQGGIMSASVALSSPEAVAGFAILCGRILPELEPRIAGRERLAKLSAFIGHGELDTTLPPMWAQRSDQRLGALGVEHLLRLYPIGHGISAAMQADFLEWLHRRIAQADAKISGAVPTTLFAIGAEQTTVTISNGSGPAATLVLDVGWSRLAGQHFTHDPSRPAELEAAIMTVEDALAPARSRIAHGSRLVTNETSVREIAVLAGISNQDEIELGREAIEQTFQRLTAAVLRRSMAGEGLPAGPRFVATLLILREFMHHMDFASITVLRQ